MAQQGKKNNYDAIGGIFDFIFSEADKPPSKRRPITPSGVSAEGILTDAIFATLEKPGAFVTNTLIDQFNDSLEVSISKANFNEYGKIEVTTQNLASYLKDPAGTIDKEIAKAKAARKASRVRMLGEALDDFLTTTWAHKYGDLEAKKITLANASANERKRVRKIEENKISRAVGQTRRVTRDPDPINRTDDFMINRSLELMGRKTFGNNWDTLADEEREKFNRFFQRKVTTVDAQRFLVKNFGKIPAQRFNRVLIPFGRQEEVDISDPEVYKALENDHLTGRINALSNAAPGSDEEKQRKIYEKTKVLINLRTKEQVKDLEDKLENDEKLRKEITRNPNRTDRLQRQRELLSDKERKKIEKAIDDGKAAMKLVGGRTFLISKVGQWEGYINSINGVWGGFAGAPNFIPSIVNGTFFDARRNQFSPLKSEKTMGGYYVAFERKNAQGVKKPEMKFESHVDILVAKDSENKVTRTWNEMGEQLYYMTPKSIFRTFFYNGEGFARLLYRKGKALEKFEEKVEGFGVTFIDPKGKITPDIIMKNLWTKKGKELDTYVDDVLAKIKGGKISSEDFKKIEKLLNSSKNLSKLTRIFSMPAAFQTALKRKFAQSRFVKKIRANVVRRLLKNEALKNLLIKTGGTKFLSKFIAGEGLKNLVKPLVTAVASALGIALTPVGSFVIMIATGVIMDLAMKIGKILFQIGVVMLIGIVAVFVLGFGGARKTWRKANKRSYSYNYVVPDTVNFCPAYGNTQYPEISECDANCTPNLPVPDVPCLNVSETIRLAEIWTGKSQAESTSNVERCLGDVVQRALSSGADPIFTIAIWIHESAASDYCAFDYPIEDWGIHGRADVPMNDFNAQLNFWLPYPNYVRSVCQTGDLKNFISYYWFGSCQPRNGSEEMEVQRYIDELKFIYSVINTCGTTLPSWPKGGQPTGPEIPIPPDIIPPPTGEACVLGEGRKSCTQGWTGTSTSTCFSHFYMRNVMPVDLVGVDYMYAPQFCGKPGTSCKITSLSTIYCNSLYQGGDVFFEAYDGNTTYTFRCLHCQVIDEYKVGDQIQSGKAFAWIENGITVGPCWSGKHLHFQAKQNGSVVDPLSLLQAFECDVPSVSGCTNCVN